MSNMAYLLKYYPDEYEKFIMFATQTEAIADVYANNTAGIYCNHVAAPTSICKILPKFSESMKL